MKRSLRALSVATALSAVAAAAPVMAGAAVPAFYTPPATLPGTDGAIVRTQPMKLGASILLPGSAGQVQGTATRIMYESTNADGVEVAVTGTYIEPKVAYTRGGPRPLVVYAEGTQGQGDQCAPSLSLENPLSVNEGSIAVGYETGNINGILARGIAVVVPDYIGLGTPGEVHTYVDRVDLGHAVLDAARAALQLPGTTISTSSPIGLYGYSQGGGAAASAAELAPTYAPDLNLKGAYAGAPPANLLSVMQTADGTSLTAVIGFAINGFVQNDPALKPILDENTNAAGKAALAKVSTECIGDALASFAYKTTSQWTSNGHSAADVVQSNPTLLAAVDEQRIGKRKPAIPVRIVTGTRDDIVGHVQDKQLAEDWCAQGANVTYVPVIQNFGSYGTTLNHLGPMVTSGPASQTWLADRLAGLPAAPNCAAVPKLP
jgi:dienelactone hydrolase